MSKDSVKYPVKFGANIYCFFFLCADRLIIGTFFIYALYDVKVHLQLNSSCSIMQNTTL